MKKTLFLAVVTALTLLPLSCTKYDAPQPPIAPPAGTTAYTFTSSYDLGEVFLHEYNNTNEIIHTKTIDNAEKNVAYSYAAQDNTVKIKVYLTDFKHHWVQQVYYLEDSENIDIAITGETIVGNYEP